MRSRCVYYKAGTANGDGDEVVLHEAAVGPFLLSEQVGAVEDKGGGGDGGACGSHEGGVWSPPARDDKREGNPRGKVYRVPRIEAEGVPHRRRLSK